MSREERLTVKGGDILSLPIKLLTNDSRIRSPRPNSDLRRLFLLFQGPEPFEWYPHRHAHTQARESPPSVLSFICLVVGFVVPVMSNIQHFHCHYIVPLISSPRTLSHESLPEMVVHLTSSLRSLRGTVVLPTPVLGISHVHVSEVPS